MTQLQAISMIEQAPSASALFEGGPLPKLVYQNLARLCHPDVVTEVPKKRAERAFQKMTEFYAQITGKTVANAPVVAGYVVERPLAKGDLCDLYQVTSVKDSSPAILKIAQTPVDNDLVANEASALKLLHADKRTDEFKRYLPRLVESFKASGRQANILSVAENTFSLNDLGEMFPRGLDFRHVVWMGNRLLSILGYAHRNGIIHGAVLPAHLLYRPFDHGLVLVDWCYSVKIGEPLKARVKAHVTDYPPEVARKMPATAATDIYMAALALRSSVLLKDIPRRFLGIFEHCLAASPNARPQDAWDVQSRWKQKAEEEYGPHRFVELQVPVLNKTRRRSTTTMGGSSYSNDSYAARAAFKRSTGAPTFGHHDNIRTGKVARAVHASLSPRGVKIREARDSAAHPISVPIALLNDLTGSMQSVPITLQAQEPKLMGMFLKDRADGKTYLHGGYPAIMIAGCDDYFAIGAEGALQVGQFESGLELDDNLTNLWLTGNGGGNWAESYDLFLYFLARHTAHDHFEKRGRKGHAFVICDEPLFAKVSAEAVKNVIGDDLEGKDIPIKAIIDEVQAKYWLHCIIPNQTSHYNSEDLRTRWRAAIGVENVLLLDDPTQICELIVSTVALCEGAVDLEDLAADNLAVGAVHNALVPLSKSMGEISKHSAAGLPTIAGAAGGTERL